MNKVEVANLALSLVGETTIQDFPPVEDNVNSRRCKALLDVQTLNLLASHNWMFARSEASLTQDSDSSSELTDYVYHLPSDCIRVIDVLPLGADDVWYIQGDRLLSDADEVKVVYLSSEKSSGYLPPWFANALAYELASTLATALGRDIEVANLMRGWARAAFDSAKTTDANQGNVYRPTDHSVTDDSFVTGSPKGSTTTF